MDSFKCGWKSPNYINYQLFQNWINLGCLQLRNVRSNPKSPRFNRHIISRIISFTAGIARKAHVHPFSKSDKFDADPKLLPFSPRVTALLVSYLPASAAFASRVHASCASKVLPIVVRKAVESLGWPSSMRRAIPKGFRWRAGGLWRGYIWTRFTQEIMDSACTRPINLWFNQEKLDFMGI